MVHILEQRVVCILGIDIEEHRKVYLFVRVEPLFFKTEALDFVQISTRFEGLYRICGDPFKERNV